MKKFILIYLFFATLSFSQNNNYTILVSFDGFRWDYCQRGITPTLDSLKSNGVHAVSLKPNFPTKTFPNHTSIITGMYCDHHGIISNNYVDTSGNYCSMSNIASTPNSDWYKGEAFWETLNKNNITTASCFWPGSDMADSSRRTTYYKKFNEDFSYKDRIDFIIGLLKLPVQKRPKFLTLYFEDTDHFGHNFGPDSHELNESIKRMDKLVNYLLTSLSSINLIDSTNIILLSDHGTTNISKDKFINVGNILSGLSYTTQDYGPFMTINAQPDAIKNIYSKLKESERHFNVYTKENIPEYLHYKDDKNIFPIILSAELGWSLVTDKSSVWLSESKGNHGYDSNYLDMHGIFIAAGPDFKKGFETGTIRNIDIYPLLCSLYHVQPNKSIDGSIDNIKFILK